MVNHMREPIFARWFACCRSVRWQQDGDKRPLTKKAKGEKLVRWPSGGVVMSRRIVSRKIVVALMASVALVAISLPNNAMAFGGGHGGGGGGHFGGGGGHFGGGGGHFG